MNARTLRIALPLAVALGFARGAQAQTPAFTPALAQATFDSAWSIVYTTLWDTAVANGAWTRARAELRPRALAARDNAELRRVLTQLIGRLPSSHFDLIPGDVQARLESDTRGTGETGMDVRLVGGRFVVTRVDAGSPAAAAGVRTGWTLLSTGGRPTARVLADIAALPSARDPRMRQIYAYQMIHPRLKGEPGSAAAFTFADGAGRTVARRITLREPTGPSEKFGNLPRLSLALDTRRIPAGEGVTAGFIRFNYWFPALLPRLNAAVDSVRDTDGVIIDLRGNLGGMGAMAPGFAGHFLPTADTLGVMRMRSNTMYLVVNPRRVDTRARPVEPYAGPVAILTDALTASTSEFFAGGLKQLGRVRVFGEPSPGMALPALAVKLPSGDVLMHAVADFVGPRGQRFEGAGVVPDVAAPPTRAALLAGHDPALEAALAWIRDVKAHRAPAR